MSFINLGNKFSRYIERYFYGKPIKINGEEKICNVIALLQSIQDGSAAAVLGSNINTNSGDQFYAEKACGQTPSVDYYGVNAGYRLGTGLTSPTKADTDVTTFLTGSDKVTDANYPKTNDDDTDNIGGGLDVISWRISYTTSEANGTGIAECAIVNDTTTPTSALMHGLFGATFDKTSGDTLKVFVNHTVNGI